MVNYTHLARPKKTIVRAITPDHTNSRAKQEVGTLATPNCPLVSDTYPFEYVLLLGLLLLGVLALVVEELVRVLVERVDAINHHLKVLLKRRPKRTEGVSFIDLRAQNRFSSSNQK